MTSEVNLRLVHYPALLDCHKLFMSSNFKEAYLNRLYGIANGKGIPRRRPDVMTIYMNGKVHAIELASKTDMGTKCPTLTSNNDTAIQCARYKVSIR